jgi:hypothetical protein
MLNLRFILPVFLALALLLAQQGGIMHALRHVFAEQTRQQDKQTPHAKDCEQCTSYAQLGSALNSSFFSFGLYASFIQDLAPHHVVIFSRHPLAATARGPPALQSSV